MDLQELKASVRSVLLSVGKTANEQEFRKAYYDLESQSFNVVLRKFNVSFKDLFMKIPDVAKLVYIYDEVYIQRVSNEATQHMDHLTINKYSKNFRGPKRVTKFGTIKLPVTRPLRAAAIPYNYLPAKPTTFNTNNSYLKTSNFNQPNANIKISVASDNQRKSQFYQTYGNNYSTSTTSQQKPLNTTQKPYQGLQYFSTSSQHDRTVVSSITSLKENTTAIRQEGMDISIITSTKSNAAPKENCCEEVAKINVTADNSSVKNNHNIIITDISLDSSNKSENNNFFISKPKPTASSAKSMDPNANDQISALKAKTDENERVTNDLQNSIDKVEKLKLDDAEVDRDVSCKNSKSEIEVSVSDKLISNKENVRKPSPILIKNRLSLLRLCSSKYSSASSNKVSHESVFFKIINSPVRLQPIAMDEKNPLFEIIIIDVLSPSKFAFQFSLNKIKEMKDSLNYFYNHLQDVEKYRLYELVSENIVAIRQNGFWHRGQILSADSSEVLVQFVDSLKIAIEKVSPDDIYHLHEKFTVESPKSAFGRIYGLEPNEDNNWNIIAASKLINIQDKTVWASVKNVDDDGVFALSIITDINEFKNLFDLLIEEGLADIKHDDFTNKLTPRSLV